MGEQTFIIKLQDANHKGIVFERFGYKKPKTCLRKMREYMLELSKYSFYKQEIQETKEIVVFEASDNSNQVEIQRISIQEFLAGTF